MGLVNSSLPLQEEIHAMGEGRRRWNLRKEPRGLASCRPLFATIVALRSLIIIEFLSVVTIQREFLLKVDGIVESHAPLRNGGTHNALAKDNKSKKYFSRYGHFQHL